MALLIMYRFTDCFGQSFPRNDVNSERHCEERSNLYTYLTIPYKFYIFIPILRINIDAFKLLQIPLFNL